MIKETVDISVIIPTKNREKDLLECLDSLFKQDYLPKEIIIVDQSIKERREKIKSVIPSSVSLIYIYDPKITGATQARNIALNYIKSDLVLLLDDDVILLDNALKNMLNIFSNDKNNHIAGLGAYIVNQRLSFINYLGVKIFCHGPFSFWNDHISFYWKARRCYNLMKRSRIIPAGASCVKAKVFKEFSFDENLVGYTHGDDAIFGHLASSKYKFSLSSEFKIYHKELSNATKDKKKNIERQIVWWFYFFNKYVKKTVFNEICYIWSIIGILFKILIRCYNLDFLKGVFFGLKSVFGVVFNKVPIEKQMKNLL